LSSMTIYEVMERLPHRYPFLLIDRVLECVPGDRLTAIKNVTFNEPFFTGHFPVRPVMPGVLILEAMAQATGILAFRTLDEGPDTKSLYLLVGLDKARFKRQVEPGDQLKIDVDLKRRLRGVWMFGAEARVGDEIAATADVMCSRQDISA
jgi:3-hydroxyacyl-[acyl-carrier-protein] dehydratase